jgi:hypothetical protein
VSGWWRVYGKWVGKPVPPALPYVAEKASGGSVEFIAWGWSSDASGDVVGIDSTGAAWSRNAEGLAEPA